MVKQKSSRKPLILNSFLIFVLCTSIAINGYLLFQLKNIDHSQADTELSNLQSELSAINQSIKDKNNELNAIKTNK